MSIGVFAVPLAACADATTSSPPKPETPIPVSAAELDRCGVDEAELARLLSLSPQAFDQDMSGGWRAIAARPGCELAAATLLETYIAENRVEASGGVMHWHLGQMLAIAGEHDAQCLEENPDFVASDGFVDEPPNLGVLQGLPACFEETYAAACGCRP